MEKLRIVVGGFLGILNAGGVTWDYVQYPLGFAGLGHDVYYIEDTRLYPIYQKSGSAWDDSSACVEHLARIMDYFQMSGRWAYRDEASGRCFGMTEQRVRDICRSTDVFINISCSTVMREEYLAIPARVLIDSDPMFTQIQYLTEQSFTPGSSKLRQLIGQHNHFFSFGENIGADDCRIPPCGIRWRPTRQPICLDHWKVAPMAAPGSRPWTTLMNWMAGKSLRYGEEDWGQKDIEFPMIQDLPRRFPGQRFSLVINQTGGAGGAGFPQARIEAGGWQIQDPSEEAGDWHAYQDYLSESFGELSVAKETYVKGRTGWFSCRSACYLAAGRPVIAQDTGWSRYYPHDLGLLAFEDAEGAFRALQAVMEEPESHARAARRIAEEYFDSRRVLATLLNTII